MNNKTTNTNTINTTNTMKTRTLLPQLLTALLLAMSALALPPAVQAGLPPVTHNLKIQYDAQAITGLADGATVTTWNDTSGNGNNGTGGTIGAGAPIYKANGY
jgi:hypothetical protein